MSEDLNTERQIANVEISDVLLDNMANRYAGTTFDRSIPAVEDGLIEVARKTLYTIYSEKFYNCKDIKSASIVGNLLAKYHPHGDVSAYGSLVELTQWFSTSYPYLSTQSNFGNIQGDPAAAPRYTDCKGSRFAVDVIFDLISDKSIDFQPNFDNSKLEPVYLPSKLPLLLINGKPSGIALAFSSNIPPHNLEDVCNMCIKYIKNPKIPNAELIDGIYPDYPTGGVIVNGEAVERFYKTGERTSVRLRALTKIDRENNTIEILNMPYKVYWDSINNKIIQLVDSKNGKPNPIISKITKMFPDNNKNSTGDHDKKLFRITVSKDANVLEVEDQLMKSTQLETSEPLVFMVNFGHGVVRNVTIKDIIEHWYKIRTDVFKRIKISKKNELEVENHKLEGLLFIYPRIDEMVNYIKKQKDKESIIEGLNKVFKLTRSQALAISEMQLHRLTTTSKEKLESDLEANTKEIKQIEWDLNNMEALLIKEIEGLKEKYKRPRRTVILKESENNETIQISSGAILYSRTSIGLFNLVSLFNSKTITNGLKSVKVNNKNVRGIIGSIEITNSLEGVVVIQEDGTARKYSLDDIKHTNSWVEIIYEGSFIKSVLPIYTDKTNEALLVSNDNKLRRVNLNEFTNNKRNIGSINTACYLSDKRYIVLSDELGNYVLIDDWRNEIPLTGLKANGVKTSFNLPIKFAFDIDKNDDYKVLVNIHDIDDEGIERPLGTTILYFGELSNIGTKDRKPRPIIKGFREGLNRIGYLGYLDISKKNTQALIINQDNTLKLDIKHFKNESRNISYFTKGLLQIDKL